MNDDELRPGDVAWSLAIVLALAGTLAVLVGIGLVAFSLRDPALVTVLAGIVLVLVSLWPMLVYIRVTR